MCLHWFPEVVPALTEALHDKNSEVRKSATEALRAISDSSSINLVLGDGREAAVVRSAVADTLAKNKKRRATDASSPRQ
jgi:HEAT repeat protein